MRSEASSWLIWISFIPAIVLAIVPVPQFFEYARPTWPLLLVVFWMLTAPAQVGLITAWSTGLFMDIMTGTILGQQAFAMLLSAFLVSCLYKRMYRATVLEQCLLVMYVVTVFQLTYLWVGMISEEIYFSFSYLIPIGTSIVVWPIIFFVLDKLSCIYSTKRQLGK